MLQNKSIHQEQQQTGKFCSLALTSGGASALAELFSVSGTNQFVLQRIVPYAPKALTNWLGQELDQSCTTETAHQMAMQAWRQAEPFFAETPSSPNQFIGIGCTASLASSHPKKRENRVHIVFHSWEKTWQVSLVLDKDAQSREREEQLVSQVVLFYLAQFCDLEVTHPPLLTPNDHLTHLQSETNPLVVHLFTGKQKVVCYEPTTQTFGPTIPTVKGLVCGSFNPWHRGHAQLRAVAEKKLAGPVCYELALMNADKAPINGMMLASRLEQPFDAAVLLTSAPTFLEKSYLFPGTCFVVGYDTCARLLKNRFYQNLEEKKWASFEKIRQHNCYFLVAGRAHTSCFCTLADLEIPDQLADLFIEIPESQFREDVSSTEIRRQNSTP